MGYYATSIEGNINIPVTERFEVLNTIREAYAGTSYEYLELGEDATIESELTAWGFDYDIDGVNEGDTFICVSSFDGKWRVGLDEFVTALLVHATEDSAMAFRGEDGELWRFAKGVKGYQTATIIWS